MKKIFLTLKVTLLVIAVAASGTFSGPIFATNYSSAEEVAADTATPAPGAVNSDPVSSTHQTSNDPAPKVISDPAPPTSHDPAPTSSVISSDPVSNTNNDPVTISPPTTSNDPAPGKPNVSLQPNQTGSDPTFQPNQTGGRGASLQTNHALVPMKPRIHLVGDETVSVMVGDVYVDAGAKAMNYVGEDITSDIVVGGTFRNTDLVGNFTITYNVTDRFGLVADEVVRHVNVIGGSSQNQAPTITLNGSNPTTVFLGGTYFEMGAQAWDPEEGDISDRITVTGTVNANATGTYPIVYTVSDTSGATATVTRGVNVSELTTHLPPMITLLGDNPMNIVIGNAFVDPGASASDWQGDDISDRITVSSSTIDINRVGSYSVFYTVTDDASSTATVARGVNVIEDTNQPTGNNNNNNNSGGGGGGGGRSHRTLAGQVLGASTGPEDCHYLNSYLKMGQANDPTQMMLLRLFLRNMNGDTNVAPEGPFDQSVFNAVSGFQTKYNDDILNPWGYRDDESTGYVYILTNKKINELACNKEIELTQAQIEEITTFRNYIAGLRSQGLAIR